MRKRALTARLVFALLAMVVASCGGESDPAASDKAPYAALTHPLVVKVGVAVTFDAQKSGDPDVGDTLTFTFVFGDGSTATSTSASLTTHTYEQTGVFQVSVVVEDAFGKRSQVIGQLSVVENFDPFSCDEATTPCSDGRCEEGLCVVDACVEDIACGDGGTCADGRCQKVSSGTAPGDGSQPTPGDDPQPTPTP